MSLLSLSSESLDQLVSRERYLQSTFESMSGVETDPQTPSKLFQIKQFYVDWLIEFKPNNLVLSIWAVNFLIIYFFDNTP